MIQIHEAIDMYKAIVKHYNLDNSILSDIANAICVADMISGTNIRELSIASLVSSGVGFTWIKDIPHTKILPTVQIKRILCDVLGIALLENNTIDSVDFCNKASSRVARAMGYSFNIRDYADESKCDSILNDYYSVVQVDSDCAKDLDLLVTFAEANNIDITDLELGRKDMAYTEYNFSEIDTPYNYKDTLIESLVKKSLTQDTVSLALHCCSNCRALLGRYRKKARLYLPSNLYTILKNNKELYNALYVYFDFSFSKKHFDMLAFNKFLSVLRCSKSNIEKMNYIN